MLAELKNGRKVVGMKQIRKALKDGTAIKVFVAEDADSRLTTPLIEQCTAAGVLFQMVATMAEIGAACGIDVGAAAAAVIG